MLRLQNVSKFFGDQRLFEDVNFTVYPGQRIGVIGANGSGKSTLLQIAAGLIEPDQGAVELASRSSLYYLPQAEPSEQSLSGGQKQRLALKALLASSADIWLLDEPTNNLDDDGREWFQRELLRRPDIGCLVVSHDRSFLDDVVETILELNPFTGECKQFGGNYSFYAKTIAAELRKQWRTYEEQERKVKQLTADIAATKNQALSTENRTVNDYIRGRSKKVAAKAKARESRLHRMLESERKVEKPRSQERVRLSLAPARSASTALFEARDVSLSYGDSIVLQSVSFCIFNGDRVVVLGKNGSGKSTLLKLLARQLDPSSGSLYCNQGTTVCYLPQEFSYLPDESRLYDWFCDQVSAASGCSRSASDVRTFLGRFLFQRDDVFKKIGSLSCGERMRLQLAAFMAQRPDCLILDEPTNHLDLPAIESIEAALDQFNGSIIVTSHDRRFCQAIKPNMVLRVAGGHVSCGVPDFT